LPSFRRAAGGSRVLRERLCSETGALGIRSEGIALLTVTLFGRESGIQTRILPPFSQPSQTHRRRCELGRALLAVSAVCSSAAPHPEGTRIDNCHFPVVKWATGRSQSNGRPILVVEVTGGTQLALQFEPKIAEACAASLHAAAAHTTVPKSL
jgi:hypothetical protein